jgi:DNA-binding transcriptional LysR family regulator
MPTSLPPLNAVRAFEVAARHLNFSRAAEELGVTQGAISKQVILLEDYIGAKLFERLPGGLSLTQEGLAVREALTPAFAHLERAFARYRRRPPRSNVCRISTLASFASQFLAPRLSAFEREHADLKLEILTSDRLVDLGREEVDFSVRYGAGGRGDVVENSLTDGRLAPVASPKLMKAYDGKDLAGFLSSVRRIQIFSNNEWNKWSDAAGVDLSAASPTFIMEDFIVAIEAVRVHEGVALLPEILVRKHLADGDMVLFSPVSATWNSTYYTAHVPGAERQPHVRRVLDWLRNEAAGGQPPQP